MIRAEVAHSARTVDHVLVAVDREVPQTTLNTYSHAVRTLQRGAADLVGQLLAPDQQPVSTS
ncbi:UNVERIFIED_CONTAM: hypothetical protein OHV15_01980 [Microbacterium sp. SLM126]